MANDNHLIVNGTDYIGLTSTFAQCSHIKVKLPNGTITYFEPSATYLFNVNREDGEGGGTSPTTVTYPDAITALTINGKTITWTKKSGATGTLTTQDTTYTNLNQFTNGPGYITNYNDAITAMTYSGQTLTYTKKSGAAGTITTKDTTYSAGDGLTLNDNEFSLTAHIPNRIIASNDNQGNLVHLWLSYWDGNHDSVIGELPLNIIGNNVSVHADNPNTITISANIDTNPGGNVDPVEPVEPEEVTRYAPNYANLTHVSSYSIYNGGDSFTYTATSNGWLRVSKLGKNENFWTGSNLPDENNLIVTQNGTTVFNKNDGTKILNCREGDKIVLDCPTDCCFARFTSDDTSSSPLSSKQDSTNSLLIGNIYQAKDTGWLHVKYRGIRDSNLCINVTFLASSNSEKIIRFGCEPFDEWLPVRKNDIFKVLWAPAPYGDRGSNLDIDYNDFWPVRKEVITKNDDNQYVIDTPIIKYIKYYEYRYALRILFDQEIELIKNVYECPICGSSYPCNCL